MRKFFLYPYNKGKVIAKCGSAKKNMTNSLASIASKLRKLIEKERLLRPTSNKKANNKSPV